MKMNRVSNFPTNLDFETWIWFSWIASAHCWLYTAALYESQKSILALFCAKLGRDSQVLSPSFILHLSDIFQECIFYLLKHWKGVPSMGWVIAAFCMNNRVLLISENRHDRPCKIEKSKWILAQTFGVFSPLIGSPKRLKTFIGLMLNIESRARPQWAKTFMEND